MARFHSTGQGSFLGDFAYRRVLERHPDHFLVALTHLFDWNRLSARLIELYSARGLRGRRPYDPKLMIKMLFLSYTMRLGGR